MALSKVQREHIKNLGWATWFSQADLSSLRGGDWINLKEDLYEFIKDERAHAFVRATFPGSDYGAEQKKAFCEQTSEADIAAIQSPLRQRLRGFAYVAGEDQGKLLRRLRHLDTSGKRLAVSSSGAIEAQGFLPVQRFPISNGMLEVHGLAADQPFRELLSFGPQADLQAKVDLALFRRLVASAILRGQLRICPSPRCGRVFLINRRPRTDLTFYCSLRCSRGAATQRYRERLSGASSDSMRAKERERSHRRYEQKQKGKLGPNVKVGRRPRKKV